MYDGTIKFDTSMDSSGFQKDANALSNLVKGLGVFEIIKKGMQMVGDSIGAAVSRYDTLNKFPEIMEKMGYSADEAAESQRRLSDGIQGLPTTLDGIISSTKQLTIATGSLDKGTDSALALNNAFLASGASSAEAERGATQYIQMLSSGKVDMQSWRTLNETMTYALQKTAESFGFAGASAKTQLYAALRDGDITFNAFNDRIIELNEGVGGFAEVAKVATGGIGTAWTNLNTAIVKGTTGIIEAIDEGLSETKFVSIENTIGVMKDGIVAALSVVADTASFLTQNLGLLAAAAAGVGVAFAAHKTIQAWNTAAQEAARVAKTLDETQGELSISIGKSSKSKLDLAASTAKQTAAEKAAEAADKSAIAEKMRLVASQKKAEAAAAKEALANSLGADVARLKSDADKAQTAATTAKEAATKANTVAEKAEATAAAATTRAVELRTKADKLQASASSTKEQITKANEAAEKAEAVATEATTTAMELRTKAGISQVGATEAQKAATLASTAANTAEAEVLSASTEASALKTAADNAEIAAKVADTAATNASTVAETANTTATQASTIAEGQQATTLGLGAALIGYFTGTLTLKTVATAAATAATTLFGVALKALPLFAVLAAVAAVVAGIIALVGALSKSNTAHDKEVEAIKKTTKEQEEYNKSLDENIEKVRASSTEKVAEVKANEEVAKSLQALIAKNNEAGTQNLAIAGTVEELNSSMKDLGLSYDATTGQLNMTQEELDAYITNLAKVTEHQQAQDEYNRLLKEQVSLQLQINEANDRVHQAWAQWQEGLISGDDYLALKKAEDDLINELTITYRGYSAAAQDAKEKVDASRDSRAAASVKATQIRNNEMAAVRAYAEQYELSTEDIIEAASNMAGGLAEWSAKQAKLFTESGMDIDMLAEKWGVSTKDIQAYMDETGGSLDDYNKKMKATHTEEGLSLADLAEKWNTTTDAIKRDMAMQEITMQEWSDNQQKEFDEAEKQISSYAKEFNMSAEKVRLGIAQMGGDAEAWAAKQEQAFRAAQVSEDDYVEKIKSGQVEINGAYAEGLEVRRQNGEELDNIEQAYLDKYKSNIQEQETVIQKYAATYGLSVESVRADLAAMGGDEAAGAEEQEKNLRALEIAQQNYVDAIKAGNVEIEASEIMLINSRRMAGEELNAIEQAKLDRWQVINEQFKAAAESHADSIINNFERLPKRSKLSADKMIKNLQANREQYATWQANMDAIAALGLDDRTLAELEALGPAANSVLEDMLKNGGEKALEFNAQVVGAVADGFVQAENDIGNTDLSGATEAALGTVETGIENKKDDLTTAGTGLGDDIGSGMDASTAPSEASQAIANAVINDLTNADYSGITTAISTAITTGTTDVVNAAKSMSDGVLEKVKDMKTKGESETSQMMTDVNSAIVTRTPTIKASVAILGSGVLLIFQNIKTQVTTLVQQMMTSINAEIVAKTPTIKTSFTSMGNNSIVAPMDKTKTQVTTLVQQMMTSINSEIVAKSDTIKASFVKMGIDSIATPMDKTKAQVVSTVQQMMTEINSAITDKTPAIKTSATNLASGVSTNLSAMESGGKSAADKMMAAVLKSMTDNAQSLYNKAQEIANKIIKILEGSWGVSSSSQNSGGIAALLADPVSNALTDVEEMLYRKAGSIGDKLSAMLSLSPEITARMTSRLQGMVETNPFSAGSLTPIAATTGSVGGTTYNTTLNQTINAPESPSASEATREAENFLRRSKFLLP